MQNQNGQLVLKKFGVWNIGRQGTVVSPFAMRVPLEIVRSIPMTPVEAQELVSSMSPGTLHMLHTGGGSPRFFRALELAGLIQ